MTNGEAGLGQHPRRAPASQGLFSASHIAVPAAISIVFGITAFVCLNRFVAPEMSGAIGRYLGNEFCQAIAALFVAAVCYAALQWLGLAVEKRFLDEFHGGRASASEDRWARRLSGRAVRDDVGLLTASRRWYENVSHGEDFLVLSDHLLMARERQYAMNLAPIQYVVWAMPLLGFIGTVVGITDAIGGLGVVVGNQSQMGDGLAVVLGGLQFAFDTTFMGLVLVLPIMALQMPLRARGEAVAMLFHETLLDEYYARRPHTAAI